MWGCGSAGGDGSKIPCPTPLGEVAFDLSVSPPVARSVLSLNRSVTQAVWDGDGSQRMDALHRASAAPAIVSNQEGRRNKVFVIGIDSHKDTLAACVVDHLGAPLEHRSITNTASGPGRR